MVIRPSTETQSVITHNWTSVQQQVAEACQKVDRDPTEVKIVGVAKYVGPEFTAQLVNAGCRLIGENRPQALWQKREWFESNCDAGTGPMEWHLIGHLQRNKVKRTLPLVDMIQSVDSLRLAQEISLAAVLLGVHIPVLLDVNITQDKSKTGFLVDQLRNDLVAMLELPNIQLRGLMAMSTLDANRVAIRQEFAAIRNLRDRLMQEFQPPIELTELSMGMSADFEQAIAEGSTCVRIGSNLWTGIVS